MIAVEVAVEFLSNFHPGGPWVLTAIANDKKFIQTRTFLGEENPTEWIEGHSKAKRNIYFHVNVPVGRLINKAAATDIARVTWLHVDVDPDAGEDLNAERDRILTNLTKHQGLPEPTLIVFSGGGFQAFWKLQTPIDVNGSQEKADDAKLYNLQIERMLGGDSCHNVDRIMRLPGTINQPDAKKRKRGQEPVQAKVVSANWELTYPLAAFTKAPLVQDPMRATGIEVNVTGNVRRLSAEGIETELPKDLPDKVRVAIVQGSDPEYPLKGDNSRSEWLWYVVCNLVQHDVDDELIYGIITDPDFGISAKVLAKGSGAERYAMRQIAKAKEHAIEPWLARLNGEYALIESIGGKCRIVKSMFDPTLGVDTVDLQSTDGFLKTYSNQFITVPHGDGVKNIEVGKWWLGHPNRRSYSQMVFAPNENHKGAMNLWKGFAVEARPGQCSKFLAHLLILCKGNRFYLDYLLGWMAYAVQHPNVPGEVAVVIRGLQGTGKGTFARHFGSLFGPHFKHVTNPDHIVGKFNRVLEDACLVFADEALYAGNKRHESALKALITEPTLFIEPKGVDARPVRNCIHLIMVSNESWVVPARLDDRRFFILDAPNDQMGDYAYFEAIQDEMDSGGREGLLHFLLNHDISEFNVRSVPKTEELFRQKMQTMTPEEAFWVGRLIDGRLMPAHGEWRDSVVQNEIVDAFAHEIGMRSTQGAATRLGLLLGRLCPERTKTRSSANVEYEDPSGRRKRVDRPTLWHFPSLEECRAGWTEANGPFKW